MKFDRKSTIEIIPELPYAETHQLQGGASKQLVIEKNRFF